MSDVYKKLSLKEFDRAAEKFDESRHDHIWYGKKIQVDGNRLEKENYVIHFEGSDFFTTLWVNGKMAGSHRGGYVRFSFDITNLVKDGENELVVKVEDSFDMQQPRGKQRWHDQSFECWYVQTTGIWKTVNVLGRRRYGVRRSRIFMI